MVTPLKAERLKRGITAEALAAAVNVKQPAITRIENGTRRSSPELADRLAEYFVNAVTRDQILFPEKYVQQDLPPKKPIPQRLRKAS
jgi:transcriptional regulator with XRE-family HTH domain